MVEMLSASVEQASESVSELWSWVMSEDSMGAVHARGRSTVTRWVRGAVDAEVDAARPDDPETGSVSAGVELASRAVASAARTGARPDTSVVVASRVVERVLDRASRAGGARRIRADGGDGEVEVEVVVEVDDEVKVGSSLYAGSSESSDTEPSPVLYTVASSSMVVP
jgi:hypothetical protein